MTPAEPSTSTEQQERIARAAARLETAQQLEREREVAWAELAANARHLDENTARLKALRLAKAREDAEAQAREAAAKPAPRSRKKAAALAPRTRKKAAAR